MNSKHNKHNVDIKGILEAGLGEGARFIAIPKYYSQFQKKLGFNPFLGTLNLKLTPKQLKIKAKALEQPAVEILGFTANGSTYCNVKCWPCVVNKRIKGAVLVPGKTTHSLNVLEVIAPVNLRKELKLQDQNEVQITLLCNCKQ